MNHNDPTPAVHVKRGRLRKRKKINGYFYLLPALCLIVLFSYIPFIKTIYLSFFTINANNEIVSFAGLKNYTRVTEDPEFWNSVVNTIRYTIITVPATLIISYGSTAQLLRQALSNHPSDRKP